MMGGWTIGWMWIWPTLILVGLLIIGFVVVRGATWSSSTGRRSHESSARRILDERYARGEISDEEYRHRRDMLP